MASHTGELSPWHWQHLPHPDHPSCNGGSNEPETTWHRRWKADAPEGTQEITVENHRADVFTRGGIAIEFQHSKLNDGVAQEREAAWNSRLMWIIDGTGCLGDQLTVWTDPIDGDHRFEWAEVDRWVRFLKCPILIDLDGDTLLSVTDSYVNSPRYGGRGRIVTRGWATSNVLDALNMLEAPTISLTSITASSGHVSSVLEQDRTWPGATRPCPYCRQCGMNVTQEGLCPRGHEIPIEDSLPHVTQLRETQIDLTGHMGPCASCRQSTIRYGAFGSSLCAECAALLPNAIAAPKGD
jgi:hypothetical protein